MQNKMMKKKSNIAILADFNSQDEDGAIRMFDNLWSAIDRSELPIVPKEDMEVLLTDGDVEIRGRLKFRDKIWVAIPITEFKNVEKTSEYHISKAKF
jgi:hypothetical protein